MKIDTKILKFLYRKKNDGKFYDVSLQIKNNINKMVIDNYVVELENNGYVDKIVKGYLSESALTPEDNPNHANNSICKITTKGIDYIESKIKIKNSYIFSIIALVISSLSVLFVILSYFNKQT